MPNAPTFAAGSRLSRLAFFSRPPIARLRRVTTQSITTAAATAIFWDTTDIDTDIDGVGGHSTSLNASRYVARYPGWYQVCGSASFAVNTVGIRRLSWAVNGSAIAGADASCTPVAGASTQLTARTELVYLGEGDYVELRAYQTSGGNLNITNGSDEQATLVVQWMSL